MRFRFYVLDPQTGEPLPCTVQECAQAFEARSRLLQEGKPDPWRVDGTELPDGGIVSTVFLGLDHSWPRLDGPACAPVLWESTWFDPFGKAQDTRRYPSREAAIQGHAQMVQQALQEPKEVQ